MIIHALGRTEAIWLLLILFALALMPQQKACANQHANEAFSLEDINVNPRNGTINVSIKRRKNTGQAPVKVAIQYAKVKEVLTSRAIPVNQARNATSKKPFPCNEKHKVQAVLVSPKQYTGIRLEKVLARQCKAGNYSGTPNLVVVDLKRTQKGETNAKAPTKVQVRVTVENDSPYGMPNNNQGGNKWSISVQGNTRAKQVRKALPGKSKSGRSTGSKYSYSTSINLPCWSVPTDKYANVSVTVDAKNNILESNEKDNKKTFKILRNRCRDAG